MNLNKITTVPPSVTILLLRAIIAGSKKFISKVSAFNADCCEARAELNALSANVAAAIFSASAVDLFYCFEIHYYLIIMCPPISFIDGNVCRRSLADLPVYDIGFDCDPAHIV